MQGIIFKKIIHTIYGEVNNVFTVYIKGGGQPRSQALCSWEARAKSLGTRLGGRGCEYNKTEICKMEASRFVKVTDKEISELKINSVPKNTKDLCKNTQTIIRLRLGDYQGIFTLTSSR